ncbi:hypothetical protein AwErysi_01990 [Erysipelotrichaceae bacterium]|nr:hypothetical protein AwErysi_01990 [Erysipelotrichaceae bacterium]
MISLPEQLELLQAFRIFDMDAIKRLLKESTFSKNPHPLQKQQLLIWSTCLMQELLQAEIAITTVESLFNKQLLKIEQLTSLEYLSFAPLLFHEGMLLLQQYRRFTDNRRVNDMITCMLVNLHEALTLEEIAYAGEISPEYAITLFRRHTKYSPMDFYYHLKIERAQFLLLHTKYAITYISALLCFSDQSHFTKRFKKISGMTPLKYRSSMLKTTVQLASLL